MTTFTWLIEQFKTNGISTGIYLSKWASGACTEIWTASPQDALRIDCDRVAWTMALLMNRIRRGDDAFHWRAIQHGFDV